MFDLLENIANSEESYGQIILQKLLNVTETAFFNWEDTSVKYFILYIKNIFLITNIF